MATPRILREIDRFVREHFALRESARKRASSPDTYRRVLRRFAAVTGAETVRGLSARDVSRFAAYLSDRSPSYAALCLNALRKFLEWAGRSDLLPHVDEYRRRLRPYRPPPLYLKPGELAAVDRVLEDSPVDRAMFRLMSFSGLRVGELVSVRWRDLDLERRQLVVHGKGGRYRVVPVDRVTAGILAGLAPPGYRSSPARIFGFSRETVERRVKQWCRRAGVKRWRQMTPHKLRHSYAVLLLEETGNIELVRQLLGHSSVTTTQIYTQLAVSDAVERARLVVDNLDLGGLRRPPTAPRL